MRYRKRPIVVEAEQWFPGKEVDGVIFDADLGVHIETLEGPMHVRSGDYIITGIVGEKYPCRADIFESMYVKEENKDD